MEHYYLTEEGYELLKSEINKVSQEKDNLISDIDRIKKEDTNLTENSEFQNAQEQMARIENRIGDLVGKFKKARVVKLDEIPRDHCVRFATTVTLFDLDTEETLTYKIVGEMESDAKNNKISYTSPLAREIIGKGVGYIADLDVGNDGRSLEIKNIEYV